MKYGDVIQVKDTDGAWLDCRFLWQESDGSVMCTDATAEAVSDLSESNAGRSSVRITHWREYRDLPSTTPIAEEPVVNPLRTKLFAACKLDHTPKSTEEQMVAMSKRVFPPMNQPKVDYSITSPTEEEEAAMLKEISELSNNVKRDIEKYIDDILHMKHLPTILSEWGVWICVRMGARQWGWINLDFNYAPICLAPVREWAIIKMFTGQQLADVGAQKSNRMSFGPTFDKVFFRDNYEAWYKETVRRLGGYD